MSGRGNNRNVLTGLELSCSDRGGCFKSAHDGHLYIHQHQVKGLTLMERDYGIVIKDIAEGRPAFKSVRTLADFIAAKRTS